MIYVYIIVNPNEYTYIVTISNFCSKFDPSGQACQVMEVMAYLPILDQHITHRIHV